MRAAAILGVALPLALMLTGCGADAPGEQSPAERSAAAAAPSTSDGTGQDQQQFAACLRKHGMGWLPDSSDDGSKQNFDPPAGVTEKQFEAAEQACRQFAKDVVKAPSTDAADVARLKQLAACMRAHGVPGFPDPSSDGSLLLDGAELGVKTDSSIFKAAEQACVQFRPAIEKQTSRASG